jgi:hypothetical protein
MPLSSETLLQNIENKRLTIMFSTRNSITEHVLRNITSERVRFGDALDKYAPLYANDFDADCKIVGRRGKH